MLRAVLPLLVLVLLAAFAAEAQQAGKVWRLGVLDPGLPPTEDDWQRSGLVLGLRDAGYAEHQNLEFERRYAAGKIDRLPALAAELVQLKVDVIYTGTTPAVQAARMVTSIIPIVFVAVGDPVGSGLVASLSHPGGNVTGVSAQMADLGAKQLQVLKECVPSTRRVAVLWNPANVASARGLGDGEIIARSLGMTIIPVAMAKPEDLLAAFSAMTRNRPDAVFVHPTAPMWERRVEIMEFAIIHKLPTLSGDAIMARAGALITLGSDLQDHAGTPLCT